MASGEARSRCKCQQYIVAVTCSGCNIGRCNICYQTHIQELGQELEKILEGSANFMKRNQECSDVSHELFQKVTKWREDSVRRIEEAARMALEKLETGLKTAQNELAESCQDLNVSIKSCIDSRSYTDLEVNCFKQEMQRHEQELEHPSNIVISNDSNNSSENIKLIRVEIRHRNKPPPPSVIEEDSTWKPNGHTILGNLNSAQANGNIALESPCSIDIDLNDGTVYILDQKKNQIVARQKDNSEWRVVADGNGRDDDLNQFNQPTAVVIDHKSKSLIIADWGNRRVLRWPLEEDRTVQIIASGIECTGLAIDKYGNIYVSDYKNHCVQRYEHNGNFRRIAGGDSKGKELNQLDRPTHLFIDKESSLYISDTGNNRVVKWTKNAEDGIVVANMLKTPSGLYVDLNDSLYIVEQGRHCVVRWLKNAENGRVVVGTGDMGSAENQLCRPSNLSFDQKGNLYVTDLHNHRVQMFDIE